MKKRMIAIIMAIASVLSVASVAVYADSVLAGDVSGDGKVTASDARKVLRAAAGLDVLADDLLVVADISGDGKITASDARKILRAAAGLDVLPEITTAESVTEEASEEAEITTKAPETTTETTTKEPETDAPAEVVSEYPEAIKAFFDGKYYLECEMISEDTVNAVKIAQSSKKLEAAMVMDGLEMSLYTDGKNLYFKFPYNGKMYYMEMGKELLEQNGVDLSIEEMVAQLTFGSAEDFGNPVRSTEEYNSEKLTVYTFTDKEGSSLLFYADKRDNVKYIVSKDKDGKVDSEIVVSKLTATIPTGMLSTKNCTKGSLVTLMMAMEALEESAGNAENK